jgi:(E)-4-hydroxy-3-methylbut-2-enyl-diphosphate synthase
VDLAKIVDEVERAVSSRKWEGKKKGLSIAVMGCEVNGPGEARECDIGVAFGRGQGMLFSKGRTVKKIRSGETVKELLKMIGKVG